MAHYIIPAAPATLVYVQLNSMGASIEQVGGVRDVVGAMCRLFPLGLAGCTGGIS